MKTEFSIENVLSDQIQIRIGPKPNGYSTEIRSTNHGKISIGKSHDHDHPIPVWNFQYERFPWYITLTDQTIIENIQEQEKGYWMPSLVNATFQAAVDAGQMRFLIEKTMEIVARIYLDKGREMQNRAVLESMGLRHLNFSLDAIPVGDIKFSDPR